MDKYNISEKTMFDLFTEFTSMMHIMKEEDIREMMDRLKDENDEYEKGLPP